MKKIVRNTLFLLTFPWILAACGVQPNLTLPSRDFSNQTDSENLGDWVKQIDGETIAKMVEADHSFLLYIGNDYCSSCVRFKPVLIEFIQSHGTMVYHFNNYQDLLSYDALKENYPDVFFPSIVTPSFYIIGSGERVHYQPPISQFYQYRNFEAILTHHFATSNRLIHRDNLQEDGWYFIDAYAPEATTVANVAYLRQRILTSETTLNLIENSPDFIAPESLQGTWSATASYLLKKQGESVLSLALSEALESDIDAFLNS